MIFFDNTKTENLTTEHFCDLLSASAKESFFIFDKSLLSIRWNSNGIELMHFYVFMKRNS